MPSNGQSFGQISLKVYKTCSGEAFFSHIPSKQSTPCLPCTFEVSSSASSQISTALTLSELASGAFQAQLLIMTSLLLKAQTTVVMEIYPHVTTKSWMGELYTVQKPLVSREKVLLLHLFPLITLTLPTQNSTTQHVVMFDLRIFRRLQPAFIWLRPPIITQILRRIIYHHSYTILNWLACLPICLPARLFWKKESLFFGDVLTRDAYHPPLAQSVNRTFTWTTELTDEHQILFFLLPRQTKCFVSTGLETGLHRTEAENVNNGSL